MSEGNRSGQSRADQLRQKRQQSSQERVGSTRQHSTTRPPMGAHQQTSRPAASSRNSKSARPAAAAHNMPSTTYRRTSPYATPNLGGARPAAPARKLLYTRGANGVEIRMPAIPSIEFNWQTASIFIAFALLLVVILLTNMNTFQVSAVDLVGAQRVTTADVTPVVAAASKSIFTLDREKTVNAVKAAFPEFSSVQLKIGLPDRVIITVSERQPILAWVANGQTQWISADGAVMPARGDAGTLVTINSSVSVPASNPNSDAKAAADGETANATTDTTTAATDTAAAPQTVAAGTQYVDQQILQAAVSLSAQMPSGASLVYDPVSGMGWNDPKGWKVFFGLDLSSITFKQAEYQAILARLQALGISPSLISVAHVDSPYYRTE
jgi:hypothetical protein